MAKPNNQSLLDNSRFYILVFSILISIGVAAFLRNSIPSDQLYYIRMQQVFGLLAMMYWFAALAISPVGYVIGKQRMKRIEFARRAIGVSAAYFAVLHGAVALWGQLGGFDELALLPTLFQWSIASGTAGVFVLLVMAATSFDKVVSFMTYKRWKLLHRLVYLGFVLVCLHIWTIGTHLAYTEVQLAAFAALIVLTGLELYRTTKLVNDKYFHFDKAEAVTLFISAWVMVVVLIAATPVFVKNYHSKHTDHGQHKASDSNHGEVHDD